MTDLPWLPDVLYGGPIEVLTGKRHWFEQYMADVRDLALEEAAQVADEEVSENLRVMQKHEAQIAKNIAESIRALKEQKG